MNHKIYDKSYWYVVNDACRHIVYRNRNKEKAEAYALRKNSLMESNEIHDMTYTVMSGSQLINQSITSIGRLSAVG
ncbi:MAG: hypothetical protein K6L73_11575 [Cellvibrionaceae bacterium]